MSGELVARLRRASRPGAGSSPAGLLYADAAVVIEVQEHAITELAESVVAIGADRDSWRAIADQLAARLDGSHKQLGYFVRDHPDPGSEALGALYLNSQVLAAYRAASTPSGEVEG